MGSPASHAIDLAEAAYDLQVGAGDWLPQLLKAGGASLDLGRGSLGMLGTGFTEDQQGAIGQICTSDGTPDLALALMTAVQEIGPEVTRKHTANAMQSPVIELLSAVRETEPEIYEVYVRHLGCKDVLSIHAHDPDGHGVLISMPSAELVRLSANERKRWERISVHIATAHRLRRNLGGASVPLGVSATDLPLNAEALIDPSRFSVSEAVGDARGDEASTTIRNAAVHIDRARGKMRKNSPDEALDLWRAMVRGRWSLVDWFDTDGRRFVVAKPNAPNLGDPRGLTEREHQVVTYASRGESSKLISYRLGISRQRISGLLRDAMHKLAVKTPAQLVEKLRGLPKA